MKVFQGISGTKTAAKMFDVWGDKVTVKLTSQGGVNTYGICVNLLRSGV